MQLEAGLSAELMSWIADVTGAAVVQAQQLPGGNRRQAWQVRLQTTDGTAIKAFLRYDPDPPPEDSDPYTLWREATICRALHAEGVLLPEVLAVHPHLQAVLAEQVEGTADFRQLTDEEQRVAVARDVMQHLADLHLLDPRELALPGAESATAIRAAVLAELDRWESMYRRTRTLDPLIEFALGWLRRRAPDPTDPVAVVHGDAGPGNFLYADGRVAALIDWELSHLGDPMEDLAWLALRAAQEGFPAFPDRLDDYVRAGGGPIDIERIRFHLVFAELRIVILRHRARSDGLRHSDLGNSLLSAGLHRRLCVEALASASGFESPEVLPLSAVDGEFRWVADCALELLRDDIVARSTDPLVILRTKGIARAVKLLRRDRELGPTAEKADRDDLIAVLGADVESSACGRQLLAERIRADVTEGGTDAETPMLAYLARMVGRETQVLSDALGALATRHHPALTRPAR